MRRIRIVFIAVIAAFLVSTVVFMNTKSNVASSIDNAMLPELDTSSILKPRSIDHYVSKRIGFRNEAIAKNIELNDTLFGEMVHPSYEYGKQGYVFSRLSSAETTDRYINAWCGYIKKVQDYCTQRDVPFVYCVNPDKEAIYTQYLPDGFHFTESFYKKLFAKMDELGVHYITNLDLFKQKAQSEQIYNVKFDAGHWNSLGAFYGTNHLLSTLKESFPAIQENSLSDYDISTRTEKSLLVSEFPIVEDEPIFKLKHPANLEEVTDQYSSLKIDKQNNYFRAYKNLDAAQDLPRTLIFHGSYYFGGAYDWSQFYRFAFKETYAVHNYVNFRNFTYYFNLFKPDCVVLVQVARTIYGDNKVCEELEAKELNAPLKDVIDTPHEELPLKDSDYKEERTGNIQTITLTTSTPYKFGYLKTPTGEYDLQVSGTTITCSVDASRDLQVAQGTLYLFN